MAVLVCPHTHTHHSDLFFTVSSFFCFYNLLLDYWNAGVPDSNRTNAFGDPAGSRNASSFGGHGQDDDHDDDDDNDDAASNAEDEGEDEDGGRWT